MDLAYAGICMVGGLLGMMLSFYLILCFICWIGDVIDNKSWKYWFKKIK